MSFQSMTLHDRVCNSAARSHIIDARTYRSMAATSERQAADRERAYEDLARAGQDAAHTLNALMQARTEAANYHSHARYYTDKARMQIRQLVDRAVYLPMAPVHNHRFAITMALGYEWEWKQRAADFAEWGTTFAEVLAGEDEDAYIELLNTIQNSSYHNTTAMQDRLQWKWGDRVGNQPWRCECCNDFQPADESGDTVHVGGYTETWCESCRDDDTVYSGIMDAYIKREDAVPYYSDNDDYDDETEPEDHITESYAANHRRRYRVVYHHRSGNTVAVSSDVYAYIQEEHNGNDGGLWGDYHSNPRKGFIPTAYEKRKHKVYVGIECEFDWSEEDEDDDPDLRKARRKAAKALIATGMVEHNGNYGTYGQIERDGSLNLGFEFVSGYTGLDVHRENLPHVMRAVAQHDCMHEPETTGIHVHVSRAGMTPLHAAKLCKLIYDNGEWVARVAGRDWGTYNCHVSYNEQIHRMARRARRAKKGGDEYEYLDPAGRCPWVMNGMMDVDVSRYAALSFKTHSTEAKTVEFRMFQGTTNSGKALAYLEFAFACWHFAQQESVENMTPEGFAKFICRPDNRADTTYLRKHMMAIGDHHTRKIEPTYVKPVRGTANKKLKKAAKAA